MEVKLLVNSNNALNKIYTAARTCYSPDSPIDIYNKSLDMSVEDLLKTINHTINSGHFSVIEHEHLTFFISGISRACAQQLTRHRLNNYSMRSQRYCKLGEDEQFDFITPHTIKDNEEAIKLYENFMEDAHSTYNKLVKLGIRAEDARYVLPNASETALVTTLNLRQLIHICNERLCSTAQWEIREMVTKMKDEVLQYLPSMKPFLVPKCDYLGYCPEAKKRCCGRRKVKKDVIGE